MYIQSDNLQFMQNMPDNNIDLVYSDILYGTGKKFRHFTDLPPNRQAVYDFYTPRLVEMHRVLKSTGSIYLQMDYRINHWVRDIMDSVFGYSNFRNEIIWYYNSAPRKKGCFGSRHDTILRYSKSDTFTFNDSQVREPYALSAPRGYEKEKYYSPLGKVVGDVWQINMLGQNDKTERVGYDTQKPLALIERIVKVSSNEGDVVADFFLGSGTTAVACKKLSRHFIGCDISKEAIDITNSRLDKIKCIQP